MMEYMCGRSDGEALVVWYAGIQVCKQLLRWMASCVIHHVQLQHQHLLSFSEGSFSLSTPRVKQCRHPSRSNPTTTNFYFNGVGDCSNSYFVRFFPSFAFPFFFCFHFRFVMKERVKVLWHNARYSPILGHCIISKCQRQQTIRGNHNGNRLLPYGFSCTRPRQDLQLCFSPAY